MALATRRRQRAGKPAPGLTAAPVAAQHGVPRWIVVLGLFLYCSVCWTVVVIAAQAAYRQFTPHEMVAQQGAGGERIARR